MSARIEGSWPGKVTLRKGWARAEGRPWNDAVPMAQLRVVRGGGSPFIGDCVSALCSVGATGVLSPPLPRSAQEAWKKADFEWHATLALMRRTLDRIPPPGHIVHTGSEDDLPEVLRIDHAAFEDFWQFDELALREAMAATPRSILQVVKAGDDRLAGYAVIGAGATLAYLQRVAVDPRYQGAGIGRSLVRSAARWARTEGASALMLNTPVGNEAASSLYESESFHTLDEPLEVLKSAG